MDATDIKEVNQTLWTAADEMRANSKLDYRDYRDPVLGLIFLAYAEHRFEQVRPELEAKATARRPVSPDDYKAKSVLFVPDEARLSNLALLPEATDLGAAANVAMRAVEEHNPELKDVLPRGYQRMENEVITSLLRLFARYLEQSQAMRSVSYTNTSYPNLLPLKAETQESSSLLFDRSANRRSSRTIQRQSVRPFMRLRRHVRPMRQIC